MKPWTHTLQRVFREIRIDRSMPILICSSQTLIAEERCLFGTWSSILAGIRIEDVSPYLCEYVESETVCSRFVNVSPRLTDIGIGTDDRAANNDTFEPACTKKVRRSRTQLTVGAEHFIKNKKAPVRPIGVRCQQMPRLR